MKCPLCGLQIKDQYYEREIHLLGHHDEEELAKFIIKIAEENEALDRGA